MIAGTTQAISTVQHRGLQLLDRARSALARARSVDEVAGIIDEAEAFRVCCKKAKASVEIVNLAVEAKLRAERRAGEFLAAMEKNKGAQGVGAKVRSHDGTTLEELGINKNQSSRWQRAASVPDEDFEQYIETSTAAGKELTSAAVLRLAATPSAPKKRTPMELIRDTRRYLEKVALDWPKGDESSLAGYLRNLAEEVETGTLIAEYTP